MFIIFVLDGKVNPFFPYVKFFNTKTDGSLFTENRL